LGAWIDVRKVCDIMFVHRKESQHSCGRNGNGSPAIGDDTFRSINIEKMSIGTLRKYEDFGRAGSLASGADVADSLVFICLHIPRWVVTNNFFLDTV
jgi:hypothetical protein